MATYTYKCIQDRLYIRTCQYFLLAQDGVEDVVCESQTLWRLVGIDLDVETAPGATTLRKFRRLPAAHHLTRAVLDTINGHLK
jgi:hypothetical protein